MVGEGRRARGNTEEGEGVFRRVAGDGAPYERQMFVCTYGAWCRLDGSDAIRSALKAKAKELGIEKQVRVTKSGCFGQCGNGPMIACWPENVWYHKVRLEDVDEIAASHLARGRPVERLRYHAARPGSNKTPEVKAKEAALHDKQD